MNGLLLGLFVLLTPALGFAEPADGDCYCYKQGVGWGDHTGDGGGQSQTTDFPLSFSASSDASQNATFFLALNGSAATSGVVSRPMTCTALYVRIGTGSGASGSWTVTAQNNAQATTMTCPLNNVTTCNDTAHSFSVVAGDRIRFAFTESGTATGTGNASVGLACNSD